MPRKIVFLTGTRADFGKMKSLMEAAHRADGLEVHVFVTGMHMNPRYGRTIDEVRKCGFPNIFPYHNHIDYYAMDAILSSTIAGFSCYVKDLQPDLVVLHGDRVEALAGAIVGTLNNTLTAHIEGGELSGTVDESIRHAVSKLSHVHLVSNEPARRRLIQMGEGEDRIFVIGSPDTDLMLSGRLPPIAQVRAYYEVPFDDYALLLFHPVTTEIERMASYAEGVVDAAIDSGLNYIVVFPNNDLGSEFIFDAYRRLQGNPRFRVYPSLRFEYFLVLLKHAQLILGNSSAGIMEAPYFGVPTVNVGTRQRGRTTSPSILNCNYGSAAIGAAIRQAQGMACTPATPFGGGDSAERFLDLMRSDELWRIQRQKVFHDRP
jgi:UDP-N-acetylglucosamine 2-epimerase (hydrolysing)